MEYLVALLSGFTLGALHAFDADHIAAVTAFTSNERGSRSSALLGVVWGLGHSATLLLFGLVVTLFRFVIPPLFESVAEAAIGVVLLGIGVWTLRNVFGQKKIHIHKHTHDGVEHIHFHSHEQGVQHHHRHSLLLVGAAHGLAGTASVLVLIPVTMSDSVWTAIMYLLLFGLGTTVAMGAFASVLGIISTLANARRLLPVLQSIAGIASIVVGLVWISSALFP